jgi:7-cyano-7-deazaguanine synthase in queuosine biosynthesis
MRETVQDIRARVKTAQANYKKNIRAVDAIFQKERGYVFRSPIKEPVIMAYSGGLDSTVAIDMIIKEWDSKVYPLFFRRGQRSERFEEESFDYFTDFFKKRYPSNMGEPMKMECRIPSAEIKQYIPKEMTLTVGHPMRNSTMQNRAVEYAVALNNKLDTNIRTILTGSVADDNTEPELGLLSIRTQNLNVCVSTGDWRWQVASPLTEPTLENRPVSKETLIRYAYWNSIPLEKTRSCFGEDALADGTCSACVKRIIAFEKAGFVDGVTYREAI